MNSANQGRKNVFHIPAGVPFVNSLARCILSGNLPHAGGTPPDTCDLPQWTILLPTRRASRALMQSFMDHSDQSALLLPRIQPLGDIDEDEIAFSGMPESALTEPIPQAVSTLERQFILFRLIHDWTKNFNDTPLAQMLSSGPSHAFELARSLGTLVDNFETAGIELAVVESLFDGEFAEHRQQILNFLSIVKVELPGRLAELNKIGASDRRNRLMHAYQLFLNNDCAQGPVIAAGSTGSIPATSELLSTIANMSDGTVVLPGLDMYIDDKSWKCLPENHPQFGMRELLGKMEISRENVRLFPGISEDRKRTAQNWLVSEVMRPAETTDQWRDAVIQGHDKLLEATNNVTILDAEDQHKEAMAIALIMRHGLETDKSVALVTPDRQLARYVKAEMMRWNIDIDDTAGEPLANTSPAIFLRLLLDCAQENFSPLSLKALLAHPLIRFDLSDDQLPNIIRKFEIAILRSDVHYAGLTGLKGLCSRYIKEEVENKYAHPAFKNLDQDDWNAISNLVEEISIVLKPLSDLFVSNASLSLDRYIYIHLTTAEAICEAHNGQSVLWQGEEGEKLVEIFGHLQAASSLAPEVTPSEYVYLLEQQLLESTVRPKHVSKNLLSIFGLLEARLIGADILIMGGLNEVIWPGASELDAWLTRPQLRNAGLPVPERRIGLSAHDFAQGFCARQVFLTYSKKVKNSPAVPSRWILRLQALLKASGEEHACDSEPKFSWLSWASLQDIPASFLPALQPSPSPPAKLRPVNFSVTGIEKLLKNPYAFFADKILNLQPLNSLNQQPGAAERGTLIHRALQIFIDSHPEQLPEKADEGLMAELDILLEQTVSDAGLRLFWRPQFRRIAKWFVEQEIVLRKSLTTSHVEVSGQCVFNINGSDYLLTARADRLDILKGHSARIIDYKTGIPPSFKSTAKAFSPQLLLEAVIASQRGFGDLGVLSVDELAYMKLSGGIPAGDIKYCPKPIESLAKDAENGVRSLLSAYSQSDQPYLAIPEANDLVAGQEYDYLSRWREWAHLLEQENA